MKLIRRWSVLHHKVALFLLACALNIEIALAKSPKIASTSLCGDSYLLALAPQHISHLSWQSRDPLSLASAAQKNLPQLRDEPEILAKAQTEIILFGPGEGAHSSAFLSKANRHGVTLKWGEDFETLKDNARLIDAALGIKAGDEFIKSLQKRLAKIEASRALRPKILYLSRSGATAGKGTFVDAAIMAAGGANIIQSRGWHSPDSEILLALEPDLIITSFFNQGYESLQARSLRHKSIRDFIKAYPRLDIPGALWPCAGPNLIDATELIAAKIATLP